MIYINNKYTLFIKLKFKLKFFLLKCARIIWGGKDEKIRRVN
jgi:hypothetical protein